METGNVDAVATQETCPRYPKRQPGGYRCRINCPVEPKGLVGRRVSVRWSRPEKLDGAETLTEHWHQGEVVAYCGGDCKHTVEYDAWDGVAPRELRIGLDATVLVDLTHDPPEVDEPVLVKLQNVLQLEVQGLSSALEQKPPSKKDKLEAQAKLEQKQKQLADVNRMLEQLHADAQAAEAALQAKTAAAEVAEAARQARLPTDCAIMQRVGPSLAQKWAQPNAQGQGSQADAAQPAQREQRAGAGATEQLPGVAADGDAAAMQVDGTDSDQQQQQQQQEVELEAPQGTQQSLPQPSRSHCRVSLRELLALTQHQSPSEQQQAAGQMQAATAGRAARGTRHLRNSQASSAQLEDAGQGLAPTASAAAAAADMEAAAATAPASAAAVAAEHPAEKAAPDCQQGPPAKRRKTLHSSQQHEPEQQHQQALTLAPGAKCSAELRQLMVDLELQQSGKCYSRKSAQTAQQQVQGQVHQQPPAGQQQQQPVGSAGAGDAAGGSVTSAQHTKGGSRQQQEAAANHSCGCKQLGPAAEGVAAAGAEGDGAAARQGELEEREVLRQQQEAAAMHKRSKKRRQTAAGATGAAGDTAAAAAGVQPAPEQHQQQQQQQQPRCRSPLKPLPTAQQQGSAGANSMGSVQQCCEQQQAAVKGPSASSGGVRSRRRSEQQQPQEQQEQQEQQQLLADAEELTVERLEQLEKLPVEVRRLNPKWAARAELTRTRKAAQQQQQQFSAAEPSTGPGTASLLEQLQPQQQQSEGSKCARVSRELAILLEEAADEAPAADTARRPSSSRGRAARSSATSQPQPHSHAQAAEASGPAPAQQQGREQGRDSIQAARKQRHASEQCPVQGIDQAAPSEPAASAASPGSATAAAQQRKQHGGAKVLSNGSRPTRSSGRHTRGCAEASQAEVDAVRTAQVAAAAHAAGASTVSQTQCAAFVLPQQQQQQQQQDASQCVQPSEEPMHLDEPQQQPPQQEATGQEQVAAVAGLSRAAVAPDAQQAMLPPAAVSRGPQRRSQQQVQQPDPPASAAAGHDSSLQAADNNRTASAAPSRPPEAAVAVSEREPAAVSGAAAVAVSAAGPVFKYSKAAEAAAEALLKNGTFNPANIPGLEFSRVEWVWQQLSAPESLSEAQSRLDAQVQESGAQQGARLDLLYLDQQLKDAYYDHMQKQHEHQLFKELDVSMRLSPEGLVGRFLRVYWEANDAWFAGSVVEYDQDSALHKVVYSDGEQEWLWMGIERVRLLINAGEELRGPDAGTLQQLAHKYTEQAQAEEQKLAKKNKARLDDEDLAKPGRLRAKGQALLGAACIKARQPPPDTWLVKAAARLAGAGSGGGSGKGKKRKSTQGAGRASTPAAGAAVAAAAGAPEAAQGAAATPAPANLATLTDAAEAGAEQQQQPEQGYMDVDMPSSAPAGCSGDSGMQECAEAGAAKRARLSGLRHDPSASMRKQALHRQVQQDRAAASPADADRSAATTPVASRESSPAAPAASDGHDVTPGADDVTEGGIVRFSVRPGEVVWVQVKPNPPWPALVISSEEAADFSVKMPAPRGAQVCIQYFGDYSRARVPVSCLIPTKVALQQRLWLKTVLINRKEANWVNQVKSYRIGLREFITYCKDGVLPDSEMVPEHNDERWQQEECAAEREAAASAKDAAGKNKHRRKVLGASQAPPMDTPVDELLAWAAAFVSSVSAADEASSSKAGSSKAGEAKLPLQLAPSLLLVSLGRVEYVHPRFHSDKFIFPVGFAIKRRAKTPCSADKEVWHTAEILDNPDGSGPLFSVKPDGGQAVTGSSATAAWQELYKDAPTIEGMSAKASAAAVAARAASVCGPRLFGLQHPVIGALIECLPDAALCENFLAWKGTPPAAQPTSHEALMARRMISAQLSRLPPNVTPQVVQRRGISLCDSCGEEQEVVGNHLLECDGCGLLVHMGCYGVASHPNGEAWLCDVCVLLKRPHGVSLTAPPACALCPCIGGVMKPTAEGGWCHLMCASWMPGCTVADGTKMEPIVGTQRLHKNRLGLKCKLCSQPYGACIQCAHKGCSTAFHATCARNAGYPMLILENDSDSEDEDTEDVPAQQQDQQQQQAGPSAQQQQQQMGQPGAQAAAQLQQDSGQPGAQQPQQQSGKRSPGKKDRAKGRGKGRKSHKYKGGTAAGDNTRLVCYCKKHHAFAATVSGVAIHNKGSATAGGSDSQHGGDSSRQSSPGVSTADAAGNSRALASSRRAVSNLGRQAPAVVVRQGVMLFGDSLTAPPGTTARSRPADMSCRRHLKAPDAADVAQRKRMYMQSLPHLVTGRVGTVQQLLPPPPSMISYIQPTDEKQQQQGAQQDAAAPTAAAGNSSVADGSDTGSGVLQLLQGRLPAAESMAAAAAGSGPSALLSQADRYRLMLCSINDRLCTGKSAIHGLGVFVKRPHQAGDYLIEYMGHLVRPFMTDHLERTTYNDMVGAGTYIFHLTDESSVDATRGGNMAHLINHSCAPVAHSRMITVRNPDTNQLVDHVIIVASRNLQPGDEITYDYRFNSDDKLRCNCGAPTCRGYVNAPSKGDDSPKRRAAGAAAMLVPRSEVEILKGRDAVAAAAAATAFPLRKQLQL